MNESNVYNIDEETISQLSLRLSDKPVSSQIAPNTRVFEYPNLEDVFIMESDLYGNTMPKDTCFLAFPGRNGLIGKQLKIEILKKASMEEIKKMVEINSEG